jgi:20S proteasome subunit beta 3
MVPISVVPILTTLLVSIKSAYHRTAAANMVQEGYCVVEDSLPMKGPLVVQIDASSRLMGFARILSRGATAACGRTLRSVTYADVTVRHKSFPRTSTKNLRATSSASQSFVTGLGSPSVVHDDRRRDERERTKSQKSTTIISKHTLTMTTTGMPRAFRPRRASKYSWRTCLFFAALALANDPQFIHVVHAQQDPSTMNGGSLLAMAGTDCVALAVDKRFGSGPALVNIGPRNVLAPSSTVLVGFTGLEGDVQSLQHELTALVSSQQSRGLGFMTTVSDQNRRPKLSPKVMASLTSHVLYGRKQAPYYVEPLVIGLQPEPIINKGAIASDRTGSINQDVEDDQDAPNSKSTISSLPQILYRPFLCSMDMIGATSESKSFVCAGAASKSLFGTAEALWEPDMDRERLIEVCGKAFLSALERDCFSGYGAIVYLITKDGIVEYDLAGRND